MGFLEEARENHVKKKVEEGQPSIIPSVLIELFELLI
jgi:hypothetical protein